MKMGDLNSYIKHYLEDDKTQSAIMLTAPWGTGKSYYIRNELIPYLNTDSKQNRCVVVSLYGLNSLADISKSLYLEIRSKLFNTKSEAATTGTLVAKTVAKGLANFFGVDLSLSDEDLKKLYQSIDLSNRLIVFEDVERTSIDIIEFLGYVNSLVEQDEVKVLLVANEEALIEYVPTETETKEEEEIASIIHRATDNKNRTYTEKTKQYLRLKEKTISDTLIYDCDFSTAITNIIKRFPSEKLKAFADCHYVEKIVKILNDSSIYNLRSFLFACQKTNDILLKLDEPYENDFIECIFFGNILYAFKLKTGKKEKWDGTEHFSISMGSEKYPLFHFCFDYIIKQILSSDKIKPASEALKTLRLYDNRKSAGDKDLNALYCYYINTENDVLKAVQSISTRLDDINDISFFEYSRLAIYALVVKFHLGCDVQHIKEKLIQNLHNRGNEINPDMLFTTLLDAENEPPELVSEFKDLKKRMTESLLAKESSPFGFDYEQNQISSFYTAVINNETKILSGGSFANRLNMDRVADLFAKSTPEQMEDIRGIFVAVYRAGNIKQVLGEDLEAIEILAMRIEKDSQNSGLDKVQRLQYKWFLENLKEIICKLT